MNAKQAAAFKAVSYIEDGMVVGLGTGSTAYWAIHYVAERVAQGLKIITVATSEDTFRIATEKGITVSSLESVDYIDIDIDGADEADKNLCLIKGGGGALLREKVIAAASKRFLVIADESKKVEVLGKFPLPVEVVPFGWQHTAKHLSKLNCEITLRKKNDAVFVTDNSNYILDCNFQSIPDPALLEQQINAIPGVAENGLFVNMAASVVIGYNDGTIKEFHK
ncbi:MAG: ribose-5-phosphate isomerase RpiA [Agriterribacter sp.]